MSYYADFYLGKINMASQADFSQKINMTSHADFSQKINMASHADFYLEKLTWPAMLIFLKK